jgi:hypothetical protein
VFVYLLSSILWHQRKQNAISTSIKCAHIGRTVQDDTFLGQKNKKKEPE